MWQSARAGRLNPFLIRATFERERSFGIDLT